MTDIKNIAVVWSDEDMRCVILPRVDGGWEVRWERHEAVTRVSRTAVLENAFEIAEQWNRERLTEP